MKQVFKSKYKKLLFKLQLKRMPNSTKVCFTNYFTIKQDFKNILTSKYMLLVFVNILCAKAGRRTAQK